MQHSRLRRQGGYCRLLQKAVKNEPLMGLLSFALLLALAAVGIRGLGGVGWRAIGARGFERAADTATGHASGN
jgi:hypothetical protein